MSISTRPHYIKTYLPLVTYFTEKIRAVNYGGIPEPFLPAHGKLYEGAATRIAFIGFEMKSPPNSNITDFIKHADTDPEGAVLRIFDEFEDLQFCNWGNNWKTGFWDFVFRILADFYGIADWTTLKRGENDEILRSFAWGNTNAVERYEVTAKGKGVVRENWLPVKEAGKCFDRAKHLIEVLQPQLMIVTHWWTPEQWLLDGLGDKVTRQDIEKHLCYYFLPATKTHVLWTAHPRWLATHPNLDTWSKKLVDVARQKMTCS